MAREVHPDKRPDDPEAKEKFQQLQVCTHCQKRPTTVSKETYYGVKRPTILSKEIYYGVKRDLLVSKETYAKKFQQLQVCTH